MLSFSLVKFPIFGFGMSFPLIVKLDNALLMDTPYSVSYKQPSITLKFKVILHFVWYVKQVWVMVMFTMVNFITIPQCIVFERWTQWRVVVWIKEGELRTFLVLLWMNISYYVEGKSCRGCQWCGISYWNLKYSCPWTTFQKHRLSCCTQTDNWKGILGVS